MEQEQVQLSPAMRQAVETATRARAFHWPLEFPDVMHRGGFDVVLGNPPWELVKLQEKEFFAVRDLRIATATTKAARSRLIKNLENSAAARRRAACSTSSPPAKSMTETTSVFVRVDAYDGGAFL